MYKESFPSRLKKAREDIGMTQREVAKETGISQPSIAQYETGTREPDIETLGILINFYQVSADWLFGNVQKEKIEEYKNRNTILKEVEQTAKKQAKTEQSLKTAK